MEQYKIPNPDLINPLKSLKRTCFLKNVVKSKRVIVGDYTYYDNSSDPLSDFSSFIPYIRALSLSDASEKLIIGKFCSIASCIKFMVGVGNHDLTSISTYPFDTLWCGSDKMDNSSLIKRKDTIIGNDVWIGHNATIMPGVEISDGCIIGTNSLVTKNIPPYSIIGGNPAKIIRKRFDDTTIQILLKIKWWDWEVEKIRKNIPHIMAGNISELEKEV